MRVLVHHRTRAKPGEESNGDAVVVRRLPVGERIAVVDGLGHGPEAARAAAVATDVLMETGPELALDALFALAGKRLRGTRGVALSVFERRDGELFAAGVGNVAIRIDGTLKLPFVGTPGILGGATRRLRIARAIVTAPFRLVMHSDGVSSRFDMEAARALSPELFVDRLMRDHAADHDDASVVVADFDPSFPTQ